MFCGRSRVSSDSSVMTLRDCFRVALNSPISAVNLTLGSFAEDATSNLLFYSVTLGFFLTRCVITPGLFCARDELFG